MGPLNFRGNIFFFHLGIFCDPFTKWLQKLLALSGAQKKRDSPNAISVYIHIYEYYHMYSYMCTYVLSHFCHVRLCDLIDYSLPGSSVLGFSRTIPWSGLPCPPPWDLPDLRIKPTSPTAPALKEDRLLLSHRGSPCIHIYMYVFLERD